MADRFTSFEMLRHGHKEGEHLSEKGREQAKEKGREVIERIQALPDNAVICFFSSNIGRAIDTKDAILDEVRDALAEDPNTEFVAITDTDRIKDLTNSNERMVITEAAPQASIGWSTRAEHPADEAFDKYKKRYGGEDIPGKIWLARKDELPALKAELQARFPDIDSTDIDPASFKMTPEEFVSSSLTFVKRMEDLAKKNFPDRPVYIVAVSHNYNSDYLTIVLLGMPLNAASVDQLGGDFRKFTESSYFTLKDDKLSVDYREESAQHQKTIPDIQEELKRSMEERKAEWGT